LSSWQSIKKWSKQLYTMTFACNLVEAVKVYQHMYFSGKLNLAVPESTAA
jgi:hypothetical protein